MPRGYNQSFTTDSAFECIQLIKAGLSTKELAEKFGCSERTILKIKNNKIWRTIRRN